VQHAVGSVTGAGTDVCNSQNALTLHTPSVYDIRMSRPATTTARQTRGYQRRNFSLRPDTARLLDRLPPDVNRSQLVDAAIQRLVKERSGVQLRKLLEEGYGARAARDLRMAGEWFVVDEEAWQRAAKPRPARK
jgi:CopG family transcriptional regulator / antitoxin EndoAI